MNRGKISIYIIIVFAFVLFLIFSGAIYKVDETQQVIITQFGKPIGEPISTPGLKIKIPFVQDVNFFEKRLLEWDGNPSEILAKDKKFILVDTYARWKISDPLKFFTSVVNEMGAQTRLDNVIEAATRDQITSKVLIEVVRNSNRKMEVSEIESGVGEKTAVDSIEVGRVKLAQGILAASKNKVGEYGIELVDIRIKRINYIREVREKVFERMIAERLRIAEKYRSARALSSSRR